MMDELIFSSDVTLLAVATRTRNLVLPRSGKDPIGKNLKVLSSRRRGDGRPELQSQAVATASIHVSGTPFLLSSDVM